jgi:hypothetical protein
MSICRSSGACEMWENEFYKHPAPLALRTDNIDFNDLLFARSSYIWRRARDSNPDERYLGSFRYCCPTY